MNICLVPMKPLDSAKERLAGVLSPADRKVLSLAMLEDVIRAALALDEVWVLNSDPEAAELARALGATPHADPAPRAGLNASLSAATAHALAAGATGVLVISADVPAVSADDVRAMTRAGGVALAPDAGGTGTNALWRAPGDAIELAFGADSRGEHERRARAAGFVPRLVRRAGLRLDVDGPDDLIAAAEIGGTATRTALRALGYPSRRRR